MALYALNPLVSSPVTLSNGGTAGAFYDVVDEVSKVSGWYFNFSRARSRNTNKSVVADRSLIFSEYQPSGLKCQPEGQGYLNAPHLFAGIPGYFAPIGKDSSVQFNGKDLVNLSASLGLGAPSAPADSPKLQRCAQRRCANLHRANYLANHYRRCCAG